MMPVALTQSGAAEWRNAIGYIMDGGLTISILLTLLVIPAANQT